MGEQYNIIIAGLLGVGLFWLVRGNNTARNFVKRYEGLSLKPYRDSAGKLTIGYGHLIKPNEQDLALSTITQQQADSLLQKDLRQATSAVARLVKTRINNNQRAALTSLVFNIGAGAFSTSTLLKLLNQKRFSEASAQFPRWTFAGGKQSPGLMIRRAAEQNLFMG